ncbi:biliverdin-producing heme oxygenase [Roseibium aestuarii]|uniref:Biliverdin-producing heme oxygenase n=1 Tax=Roseibium aestuarii TaxID=2600299 RepID=A0ABW4JS15_9HYPH|nr:biliverdin-producing heme oxygenase [Roseibium aestuarii]
MTKVSSVGDDIRFHLARETRALHDVVDQQAEFNDLHTAEGVAGLLRFFRKGFGRIETALERSGAEAVLPAFPERRRAALIDADLASGSSGEIPAEAAAEDLVFLSPAEIWGALYVVEGSRLGARMMARASDATRASRFLSESAECRYWPTFLAALSEADATLADRDGMVAGAHKAFRAFL